MTWNTSVELQVNNYLRRAWRPATLLAVMNTTQASLIAILGKLSRLGLVLELEKVHFKVLAQPFRFNAATEQLLAFNSLIWPQVNDVAKIAEASCSLNLGLMNSRLLHL
ncbi:uncharacterized protein PSFLO_00700 [Pseudozyma flocculosa]|uniref:Uncharacterized protein n=1 Tax=Pseudozyma flocculosa TaxID=84751 RepID=A0A5C3EVP3_9BASI|nr:uncharacterized protein PSFLO_00700 [Pseudozyma flocculosa]